MKKIAITCLLSLSFIYAAFSNVQAQELAKRNIDPPTNAEVIGTYTNLANLSESEEATALSNLSPETQEKVYRFHAALKMATRPELRLGYEDVFGLDYEDVIETLKSRSSADPGSLGRRSSFAETGNEIVLPMLQKYIDIAGLNSEALRKKVFLTLTDDEKNWIWKTRLALHLAVENFDMPKQLFVIELFSVIDNKPGSLESTKEERQVTLDNLEERARVLFGKADTYRLFMSLGSEISCPKTTRPLWSALDDEIEIEGGNCTCYYDTYCALQNENWLCRTGGCTEVNTCGIIFSTNCTGKCRT